MMNTHAAKYQANKIATLRSFIDFSQGQSFPEWPVEAFLEISNICDFKCAMCPTFSALSAKRFYNLGRKKRGLLDVEGGLERVSDILQNALRVHAFGYGEPTLHPDFREIIQALSDYEVLVDFFTHGMHLDQSMAAFLVETGVAQITVSFSGSTQEEYENVYLGGDFNKVLAGIKRVADEKQRAGKIFPRIEVNSLAFRHHIERLPEFVKIMAEHGVNTIHLKPLRTHDIDELSGHDIPMGEIQKNLLEQAKQVANEYGVVLASKPFESTEARAKQVRKYIESMSEEQARKKFQEFESNLIPIHEFKDIGSSKDKQLQYRETADNLRAEGEDEEFYTRLNPQDWENEPIKKQGFCLEPYKTFYTSFDGKVYPCCFRNGRYFAGDLAEETGKDIWQGPAFQRMKDDALQSNYPKDLCVQCIRKNAFPKDHNVSNTAKVYSQWFEDRFGKQFLTEEMEQECINIPGNKGIIEAQSKTTNL